ncbi:MAG: hypothetical protein WC713_02480 [Candidatus Methylomirabilota bacterium]
MEQRATIEEWRDRYRQFMHELTWLGIAVRGTMGGKTIVADPRDRDELQEMIHDLVARNRFNPGHGQQMVQDRNEIERECGVKIGKEYWSMRKPFSEYWQGRYKPDAARRMILKHALNDERMKEDQWPFEDRARQWIEKYFHGCCPQNIDIPDNQDPKEVAEEFERVCRFIGEFELSEEDRNEVIRLLRLAFIGGEYPIILNADEDLRDEYVLTGVVDEIVEAPDEEMRSHATNWRPLRIADVFERHRKYIAQGLTFEEGEDRRQQELRADQARLEKDIERRRRDYAIEAEFLSTLQLPEWEAREWSEALLRAVHNSFNINPAYREQVHEHIRWMIRRMPWEGETFSEDPWGPIASMLSAYWMGQYHPDPLRRKILSDKCTKIAPGVSRGLDGSPVSTFFLQKMFITGSREKCAHFNAEQDPELLQVAYDNDMKLIRSFELLPRETLRRIEWAYNEWLLKGSLPLAADREMPEDRERLEKDVRLYVGEREILKESVDPTMILQYFCNHWHPISKRPAPRKE